MQRVYSLLVKNIFLDSRSLSLFRVSVALVLLTQVLCNLHLGGMWQSNMFLRGLAAIFFFLFCVGYRTQWMALIASVFFMFFSQGNLLVNFSHWNGLFFCVFWSIFLPVGTHFSIDGTLKQWKPFTFISASSVFFILHIFLFHYIASSFSWILCIPLLLAVLFGFLWVFRLAMLGVMCVIHLWMYWMYLEPSHLIGILLLFVFIPKEFWQKAQELLPGKKVSLTIYYDENCLFCRKGVLLIQVFFILPHVSFLPAGSDPAIAAEMHKQRSWLALSGTKDDSLKQGFEVLVILIARSPLLFYIAPFLRTPLALAIGNKWYRVIADNRHKLSSFFRFVTDKQKVTGRLSYSVFFIMCSVLLVAWNFIRI